jgi:hypothetical protein
VGRPESRAAQFVHPDRGDGALTIASLEHGDQFVEDHDRNVEGLHRPLVTLQHAGVVGQLLAGRVQHRLHAAELGGDVAIDLPGLDRHGTRARQIPMARPRRCRLVPCWRPLSSHPRQSGSRG